MYSDTGKKKGKPIKQTLTKEAYFELFNPHEIITREETREKEVRFGVQGRTLYYMPSCKLLPNRKYINNWSENRDAIVVDRIKEIREFQNKTGWVNGCIHFAYLSKEGLVCYEGNHRFRALTEKVPFVIVDVIWDATAKTIREQFDAINKSVKVSRIHTDTKLRKKNVAEQITEFVNEFVDRCPGAVSTNPDPNRPKFEPEAFKTKIAEKYEYFSQKGYSLEEILAAIEYLNNAFLSGERKLVTVGGNHPIKTENTLQRAKNWGFMLRCAAEFLSMRDVQWALDEIKK